MMDYRVSYPLFHLTLIRVSFASIINNIKLVKYVGGPSMNSQSDQIRSRIPVRYQEE